MPYAYYKAPKPTKPVLHKTHCCGIMEIDYLSKGTCPEDVLASIAHRMWCGASGPSYPDEGCLEIVPYGAYNAPRIVTFSAVVGERKFGVSHDGRTPTGYGENFADYLAQNGLGDVVSSPTVVNWTQNNLRMWMWMPNYDKLWPFLTKMGVKYGRNYEFKTKETENGEES